MKIRSKITLMYTQLIFMVLLVSFTCVYIITSYRTSREFYTKLWDRAMITAQLNLEQEYMSLRSYNNLRERNRFVLTNETVKIYDASLPSVADSIRRHINRDRKVKSLLGSGKTIEARSGLKSDIAVFYPSTDGGSYVVIVSAVDRVGADSNRSLLQLLAAILAVSTVVFYFVGSVYAKRILSPIVVMINNVKRITANNLKRSLRENRGNDELSELSRTFNNMILRLRNSFEMQNSFIRNASHELKNPLTAILGETEIALSKPRKESEYIATLETILTETERLDSMIKDLLMLAQTDFDFSRIPKSRVNLVELMADVVKSLPSSVDVSVMAEGGRGYETTGVYSLLKIAFLNIVGNACKFSAGKPVEIRIGNKVNKIIVEVKDHGIGIPPDDMRHIMQPFYRAGNTSNFKGTGIGLTLSSRIVALHSGKLNIASKTDEGTVVTVIIDDK